MEESNVVCAVKGMCVLACMHACVCVWMYVHTYMYSHTHTFLHTVVVTEQRQRFRSWLASYKSVSKSDIKSDSKLHKGREVEAILNPHASRTFILAAETACTKVG